MLAANAHPGLDKIVLRAGRSYKLRIRNAAGDENAGASGDLDILDALKIRSSQKNRQATINAKGIDRVFDLPCLFSPGCGAATPHISATFVGLVIRGGVANEAGGIRIDNGSVRLKNSVVRGNRAIKEGGGVYADVGSLTVSKSTVRGNSAGTDGGGIWDMVPASIRSSTIRGNGAGRNGGGIWDDEPLTVGSSTVSGNAAGGGGGGLYVILTAATLFNDTFAGNRAAAVGGGIDVDSPKASASINALTVARNQAPVGGGLGVEAGTLTSTNSLIAKNTAADGPDCRSFTPAVIASAGYNLVGDTAGCTGFGAPGDLLGVNARIAKLKNNGGRTLTIALRKGSPAINHAGPTSPRRDQRGVRRRKPDIGAYERRTR